MPESLNLETMNRHGAADLVTTIVE
ncbi:MAG: hypothetical protein QOJ41_3020, partial [Acidobacteriaceae bacterium]|nr:hypothetical protein [Acidobacteriaceae bacterium]